MFCNCTFFPSLFDLFTESTSWDTCGFFGIHGTHVLQNFVLGCENIYNFIIDVLLLSSVRKYKLQNSDRSDDNFYSPLKDSSDDDFEQNYD